MSFGPLGAAGRRFRTHRCPAFELAARKECPPFGSANTPAIGKSQHAGAFWSNLSVRAYLTKGTFRETWMIAAPEPVPRIQFSKRLFSAMISQAPLLRAAHPIRSPNTDLNGESGPETIHPEADAFVAKKRCPFHPASFNVPKP